ncbi:MutS-related protein [Gordonia sp. (in: high G+C Gram-positive bacteria)]|uniref:MutS-related protein n=1 Tax=Gordonia sp. (in: high G+C Gram-positive bacteria) TaxID=84139 RepID=UPI0039E5D94B
MGLSPLVTAVAGGDRYIAEVMSVSLFDLLVDPAVIGFRQAAVADAAANREALTELYRLTGAAIEDLRHHIFYSLGRLSPEQYMTRSLSVVRALVDRLRELARWSEAVRTGFASPAFVGFLDACGELLTDERLHDVDEHLHEVSFDHGVLLSARLGIGNRGTDYVAVKRAGKGLLDRVFADHGQSFQIAPRDVAGSRILGELRGRGVRETAGTLADAADTMERFFRVLQWEAAFYLGAARLREVLESLGSACMPVAEPLGTATFAADGLYDASLALTHGLPVVPSSVDAGTERLVVISGANQGGKSTFLRAVGQAQLMMQAGLPVAAESFHADVRSAVFTHFKREEDRAMVSGKLDEEMARMSRILDEIRPASMVLFNESFASTNESEGSDIAEGIIGGLLESGHRVFFVTHMFELARRFYDSDPAAARAACFLRPQRRADGTRTFRLTPAEPEPTSYAHDLYRQIFAEPLSPQGV